MRDCSLLYSKSKYRRRIASFVNLLGFAIQMSGTIARNSRVRTKPPSGQVNSVSLSQNAEEIELTRLVSLRSS